MSAGITFSVIIPSRNRAEGLRACLKALERLDFPRDRFEVIVADDGSEPPLDAPARIVRLERSEGPAEARNRAAACARGVFLAFTDDDCEPAPDWLRRLADDFTIDPDSIAGGEVVDGQPGNAYSAASAALTAIVYRNYNADPEHARFLSSANLAVPAKMFQALGGFDASFRTSEDREFCARAREAGIRLRYDSHAAVIHKQACGLRVFFLRHYFYGKGAHQFWKQQHSGETEPAGFYRRLLFAPMHTHSGVRAVQLTALVWLSQLASALGFAVARLQDRNE